MIKFRVKSVFDAEGVCPGDILQSKTNGAYFFVVESNIDTEEYLCVKKGDVPMSTGSVARIGFETVDLFNKINVYDTDSE